jgi:hypothetical protein
VKKATTIAQLKSQVIGDSQLSKLVQDPKTLFKNLAEKLGGASKLARFLGTSRATAYNLLDGRRRWTAEYLHKALKAMTDIPMIPVTALCRAGFEMSEEDFEKKRQQSLVLDCDGAFVVKGNSMWPLVANNQYVLYKEVSDPAVLQPGDIVLAKLNSGETLIKAWYPIDGRHNEVFLASLYRGPEGFRKELFRPFKTDEFARLRRVVGIWMGEG